MTPILVCRGTAPVPQTLYAIPGQPIYRRAREKTEEMKPYYQDTYCTIYNGDCRDILPSLSGSAVVTDPPYGVAWKKNNAAMFDVAPIANDYDTSARDWVVENGPCAQIHFGSWKVLRPKQTRAVLIWDTMGCLGMGALDLPWKPSHQEIYVIGSGFVGHRGNDVYSIAPVHVNKRVHPHEKPVRLLSQLVYKCPAGVIIDPFCGSGTTLRAAKNLNRSCIGIDVDEEYCEKAARRLEQEVLELGQDEDACAGQGECPGTACNSGRDAMPLDIFEGVQ